MYCGGGAYGIERTRPGSLSCLIKCQVTRYTEDRFKTDSANSELFSDLWRIFDVRKSQRIARAIPSFPMTAQH
jgi:hypothetical protein